MPDSYKKLYQGQPGVAAGTLYTVPASTTAIIRHIRIVNNTGTARTITLWHDGITDTFLILPATSIDASGGSGEFDGVIPMEAADTLSGQASAASAITVTVYGLETS